MKSILHCRHGYSLIVCHCHFFFFLGSCHCHYYLFISFFGLLSLSFLVDIMMLILFWHTLFIFYFFYRIFWHTLNKDNVTGDFFFPIKKKWRLLCTLLVFSSKVIFYFLFIYLIFFDLLLFFFRFGLP